MLNIGELYKSYYYFDELSKLRFLELGAESRTQNGCINIFIYIFDTNIFLIILNKYLAVVITDSLRITKQFLFLFRVHLMCQFLIFVFLAQPFRVINKCFIPIIPQKVQIFDELTKGEGRYHSNIFERARVESISIGSHVCIGPFYHRPLFH